jgi:hypothetical protein
MAVTENLFHLTESVTPTPLACIGIYHYSYVLS